MGTQQGQLISGGSSLWKATHGAFSCVSQAGSRMRWLKGELLQQQQEKQGLDSSHSSGEPGLGWSNMKVLNSVLWSLWKIKCNNHLRVWNSKVDCCVVSENRQLDQTPFNACIFFFEKTL